MFSKREFWINGDDPWRIKEMEVFKDIGDH
jgi:hypothetical protein